MADLIKCQMNCGTSVERTKAKNLYFMKDGSNQRDITQNPPVFKNVSGIRVCDKCFAKVANPPVLVEPDIKTNFKTEDFIGGKKNANCPRKSKSETCLPESVTKRPSAVWPKSTRKVPSL